MKTMQAMVLAMFASAGLAGCETTTADGALPPPTPAGIHLRIRAPQSGLTVQVKVGQQFAIELVGIPTAGYVWMVEQTPSFLSSAGEARGPTIAAQKRPGYSGGNHWEIFVYTAQRAGLGTLKLVQRRPWEKDLPPTDTFDVTIAAN